MPLLTRSKISVPTMLGLVVALLSLFLISPILHFMGAPHGESVAGLVVEWALFAVLVLIIRFGEHLPLASIGLKPLGWRLALAGIMIGIGLLALITVTLQLLPAFGISVARSAAEAKAIIALPLGTRMVIVITAGIVEETFFRGYPIERLGAVFGSLPFAGLLSLVIVGNDTGSDRVYGRRVPDPSLSLAPQFVAEHNRPYCYRRHRTRFDTSYYELSRFTNYTDLDCW
jgi:membrane protease YdiL (CAAX protease family)